MIEKILAGDVRAAARLMRDLDDRVPGAAETLRELHPSTGRAFVLGVTGHPGSGKSTLVDTLIAHYRKAGRRVGVVCVDPTSPFSGGAILGDRIRMQRHATDPGVFIRSLATRGHLGGLSRSTADVATVLDAMGHEIVIVETVGVGQDEVDIVSMAHTSIVVTVPGLGDDIQAIKAGILEIADILVVNKADREGADRAVHDLTHMLGLRPPGARRDVEIIRTVANQGGGIEELAKAIERHRERTGPEAEGRAAKRAGAHLVELIKDRLLARVEEVLAARGGLDDVAAKVADRRLDPYTVADEIVAEMAKPR